MASVTKNVGQYQHSQTSSSSSWVVTHNLNTPGIVIDVMVDNLGVLEKIIPLDITMTSDNVVTINFSTPFTGKARIVG